MCYIVCISNDPHSRPTQGVYFHVRKWGGGRGEEGLDLASSLEAKFGVRSPNKRKNLGSSGTTRSKNLDIIPVKDNLIFFCLDITLNGTRK